jgi:hypothetical protein
MTASTVAGMPPPLTILTGGCEVAQLRNFATDTGTGFGFVLDQPEKSLM